jgi:SAM-dependent methyltransferase
MVFKKEYTKAYDYLYQDKDYAKECDYLETLFKKYGKNIKTVLDLGCGTGGHALILAKRGYKVVGVDRSEDMLNAARRKAKKAGLKIDFLWSSIQDIELTTTFDAVISMFAVISYQNDNEDLALACKNAKHHLKRGGLFIFDAWNGLAVLTDPPTQMVKEVRSGNERIFRYTKPTVDAINHSVHVRFQVIRLNGDQLIAETEESHKMRFLFPQEIKYFLQVAGFSEIEFSPFMNPELPLSEKDWNMGVVAR